MENSTACDDRVLELRTQGKSFAGIANTVGLARPSLANEAFNRALRRRPVPERESLRRQELGRLDALAETVRSDASLAAEGRARRLRSVDRLRTMLLNS